MFGLLGPNGAGKSTTVRVLVTLTDARRRHGVGRRATTSSASRTPCGARSATSRRSPASTASRPAARTSRCRGASRAWAAATCGQRVDELLELVGIADAADRVVRGYSGGMKRRLDVAMGLVHRPRVLFLDEPTTGLDPEARVAMWAEVGRLAEQESLTILLTTHYLEEADELADRLVIVSRGQVVARGTPAELKATLRGDAVQVEVASGDIDRAQAVLAAAGARPETVLEGRTIVARVEDGGRALPGLLAALDGAGIAVERVSVSRPSLDDVYLHYTGRDFTSEDRQG